MISEETFAREEKARGKPVHCHDGVWWVKQAPFYCKPIHEYRPFPPGSARPHPLKALVGFSHQVPDPAQATRFVRMNVLQGEDLRSFSMERIKSKRRNLVRMGMKQCRIEVLTPSDALLDQMRRINISQARKLESVGGGGSFLPSAHYDLHAAQWREETRSLFRHPGHQFIGAFADDALAAYVNLVQIEDTWLFGAVKSCSEHLARRPVDALYFTALTLASQCAECNRVVNGGGDERESLVHFKGEFLLNPVDFPYYTQTFIPLDALRKLKSAASRRPPPANRGDPEKRGDPCAASRES